ncbi:MAG: IS605 OrfB-like transposable element containing RNAse H-like and Zn finger domain [Candidatus Methanohalarchaeum thermophilum]|uniref:IS605 OrfB-like transposable element containing RNAse H-like and Zn finger domain n=1 Tax=Methanohalarchaeum thermophilum TaxID=1903181 RepID=A0A1Q6DTG1_METT1|nr:MAG: IS605 OrfB-like transposable element containing RNAse H-like and Zn finger domain [Candidatus Methanohalarchaeum thermophilum]
MELGFQYKPHEPIKEEYEISDSKVVWKPYGFELHLSVGFGVEPQSPKNILAIDLGERVVGVTVSTSDNGNPKSIWQRC